MTGFPPRRGTVLPVGCGEHLYSCSGVLTGHVVTQLQTSLAGAGTVHSQWMKGPHRLKEEDTHVAVYCVL